MAGVYRVPLRRVFNKKRIPGDPSWNDVYGKARCVICHKHFSEGDPYMVTVAGKYEHINCRETAKKNKGVKH